MPRYTHAAAPNVSRPNGAISLMSERSKAKEGGLRAARRRSKSMLRNMINFVSGNVEQQYVLENEPKSELITRSKTTRSKL